MLPPCLGGLNVLSIRRATSENPLRRRGGAERRGGLVSKSETQATPSRTMSSGMIQPLCPQYHTAEVILSTMAVFSNPKVTCQPQLCRVEPAQASDRIVPAATPEKGQDHLYPQSHHAQ